ncbi:MAG: ATP-binding cassette domain-containing protein, partial [Clostridia bacterium]
MSECVLKATGISKSFGGVHALQDVSLAVNAGEVVCLAGENGCGKSTLIKIISGYYEPDSGTIELNGTLHAKLTPRESLRAGVQVIYQDFSIFPNLSVAENIALSYLLSRNEKRVSRTKMHDIAQHALSQIGVDLPLDASLENLSVADKQIVAITRSFLDNVRMIIMDEPTSAL